MKRFALVLLCACLICVPVMAEEAPVMPESMEELWEMYLDLLARVEALEAEVIGKTDGPERAARDWDSKYEGILSATGEKFEFTLLGVKEYESLPSYGGKDIIPNDGKIFLVAEIEAHNITDVDGYISISEYDTYVDGYSTEPNPYRANGAKMNTLFSDVRAGKRMVGTIHVEADPDWKEFEINYKESRDSIITVIATPDDIVE